MVREFKVNDDTIILDSEKDYSGSDEISDEEKVIRRFLGLPIKKQLVYYLDKKDKNSIIGIERYRLVEMYGNEDAWCTVEIFLKNNESVRIHSRYLVEMQKPSFIEDIKKQEV